MSATPPSAPEPPRFSDWVQDAHLSEYILRATDDRFAHRARRYGQHVDTLLKLQRFAATRWPKLTGSGSIKLLWAAWLDHLEKP